jgi:ribosomal protein S12 methylthiotransferase accessory factor
VPLTTTYLNERIELLEELYGSKRHDQIRAVTRLYNRLLGPISAVQAFRPELLDFSIYSAACSHLSIPALIRNLAIKDGPSGAALSGGGKGATMLSAVFGALGEMAERLLAVLHFEDVADRIQYAPYADLVKDGQDAVGPDEMPLFAPEQYQQPGFGYVRFTPATFLGWIQGTRLLEGTPVWVPAQLCLMYYKRHPEEPMIGYATSGGLSFHTSRRASILHGIHEASERDGINVHWYSKIPPARVEVDIREFMAKHWQIRRARFSTPYITSVQVLLNTLDTPLPIFAAVAIDRSSPERAFMGGGGAASQKERSLAQALFEIGQSQTAFRFGDPLGRNPISADTNLSELTNFFDASLYYSHAANVHRVDWYLAGKRVVAWGDVPTVSFNTAEEEYEATMSWIRLAGLKPVVIDFSDPYWSGASLTKVVVPQLTQACGPSLPILGHPRFYELPKQLGLTDRILRFSDLNTDPVPLP